MAPDLKTIYTSYSVLLIDLWGVVWLGPECEPIQGASDSIAVLLEKNIPFYFLSNTVWPQTDLHKEFLKTGINVPSGRFITAGSVVSEQIGRIIQDWEHKTYYHQGRPWEVDAYFKQLPLVDTPDKADVLIVGDFGGTRENPPEEPLSRIRTFLSTTQDTTVIICNPDIKNVQPDGSFRYQSGYFLNQLKKEYPAHEYLYIGKPYEPIFNYALSLHPNIPSNNFVMIGDTIETDLNGAQTCGLSTVLVRSGNTSSIPAHIQPDMVINSL